MENSKKSIADAYLYSNYDVIHKIEKENSDKYTSFMEKVKDFEKIHSIEDAKELASEIIPISGDVDSFVVGDAKCMVVNSDNLFRISIDSKDTFVCYDFIQ